MARGVGPRLGRGLRFDPIDRPQRPRAPGTYRAGWQRGDGSGGANYPTVLEAYNRDSDYKRWRAGLDYWQGSGKSWADLQAAFLVRSFRDDGALPGPELVTITYFPSGSSPESAWSVVTRRRGAIILDQALSSADISFDTSDSDTSLHRLILDASSTLTAAQLGEWKAFIGDQFEDSAELLPGTSHPRPSLEPVDTLAYTLVEVDAAGGRLLFDLSRPYVRFRPNRRRDRTFWRRLPYDPLTPLGWRNDSSRYLCSSHRFFCSCPDFSGVSVADLSSGITSAQEMFPRPGASRTMTGRGESKAVGYQRRWRDLSFRSDQRRECKHIHCVRWGLGDPFYEPTDYEIGDADRQFVDGGFTGLTSEQILRYQARRGITLDRAAPALADSTGHLIDTRDTIPSDPSVPSVAGRAPILWTSTNEPPSVQAVADDWWLQRGTSNLLVFNPAVGRFVATKVVLGAVKPVIEPYDFTQLIPVEP